MTRLSINYLAALLLCFSVTAPSQAIERGSKEISHEMGSPLRQTGVIVANPRAILKTKTRALWEVVSPQKDPSLSSSYMSEEETEEEEDSGKEEEKESEISSYSHAGPSLKQEVEVPGPLNSPEFAVVQQAHDNFQHIINEILEMKDPMPILRRLSVLAATMDDTESLYEFLARRYAIKKIWNQVLVKMKNAMAALNAYKLAAADTNNDRWQQQFAKDEQILAGVKESIHKVYMPIYQKFVAVEPVSLFQNVIKPQAIAKFLEEDRELFFEELHAAESLLACLEADLDDLRDRQRTIFEESDLKAFNLKADDFIREKCRFISLLRNLKGRLIHIGAAEDKYGAYAAYQRKWEGAFKKDAFKFQAFKTQLMGLEQRVASALLDLDAEALSLAAIIRENPRGLADVIAKIADLESIYASFYRSHQELKPIHHVYDQLFNAKLQLKDIDHMRQLVNACNDAFTNARNLEKGSFADFQRARTDFKKSWDQNLKAVRLFAQEVVRFGKALNESGSEAWEKLLARERVFLRSYTGLPTLTFQWTIPALADYYDQRYQIPYRAAYRQLLKKLDEKIKLVLSTFNVVKTLRAKLADDQVRAQFENSKQKLEIQLQEAQDAYKSLYASQEYEDYREDERNEKDEEAYNVDVEELSQLNQQLVDLVEDAGEILGQ